MTEAILRNMVAASGGKDELGNLLTVEAVESVCTLERVRVGVGKLPFSSAGGNPVQKQSAL